MIDFMDVIGRVREVLSVQEHKKVLYKDIASALGLSQDYLAVIKRRGKVPYEALALFADKNDLSLNWILLGKLPKHLKR